MSDTDVYLAGTVMLIFGMGLYGLFITNVSPDVPPSGDRALKGSSLFGMFALKVSFELVCCGDILLLYQHLLVSYTTKKMFCRSHELLSLRFRHLTCSC